MKKKTKYVNIPIYFPLDTLAALSKIADSADTTVSTVVSVLLATECHKSIKSSKKKRVRK